MTTAHPTPQPTKLDKPASASAQAGLAAPPTLLGDGALGRGRLNPMALINFRWVVLGFELLVMLVGGWTLHLRINLPAWAVIIALTAVINLGLGWFQRQRTSTGDWQVAVQSGFNLVQLSALLAFSGGVANPFVVILIGPVSLGAAALPRRQAISLGLLAVMLLTLLTLLPPHSPWLGAEAPSLTWGQRATTLLAQISGMGFVAGWAWWMASQRARMELALHMTQAVLAREQRLSALGALAAAAAHELGTPLATISVVAREMVRGAAEGPEREDAELLVSQAERCREILRRLTEEPETDDVVHGRMALLQFLNEVIKPHVNGTVRVEAVVTGPPGASPPDIRRMPEVLHAMTSLVDNAVDFARSEVLVGVRFDERYVTVEVRDDGPGFSSDVLARLGQPYVTSRPSGERSRSGHIGMGIGFFIAKTLLERTGAEVSFYNGRRGGAIVAARWLRADIEAPVGAGGFDFGAIELDSPGEVDHKGS